MSGMSNRKTASETQVEGALAGFETLEALLEVKKVYAVQLSTVDYNLLL